MLDHKSGLNSNKSARLLEFWRGFDGEIPRGWEAPSPVNRWALKQDGEDVKSAPDCFAEAHVHAHKGAMRGKEARAPLEMISIRGKAERTGLEF